jgi:hypothetical protein
MGWMTYGVTLHHVSEKMCRSSQLAEEVEWQKDERRLVAQAEWGGATGGAGGRRSGYHRRGRKEERVRGNDDAEVVAGALTLARHHCRRHRSPPHRRSPPRYQIRYHRPPRLRIRHRRLPHHRIRRGRRLSASSSSSERARWAEEQSTTRASERGEAAPHAVHSS